MEKNKHKNLILKTFWIKESEFKKLINALEGNYKDTIANIMIDIYLKGDIQND